MTSVLNHAALEAAVSARYLEHYLHTVEELPNDIQMHVSQLRELDGRCTELISNIEEHRAAVQEADAHKRKKAMLSIKRLLLHLQEVGDEKLALMSVINEHIEGYARQLDVDKDDMDPSIPKENEKEPEVKKELRVEAEKVEKPTKRQRRQKTQDGNDEDSKSTVSGAIMIPVEQEDKEKVPQQKKKKKRKAKRERDNSPLPLPYDPNEPKYCLCNEVSYGEMIGCDNDKCPIEWFHFNCVELTTKPKGRWYCPKCRGDKPNVKRPDK